VKDIEDALKEVQEMERKQMAKKPESTYLSLF
jgi:hypothetical protein